MTLPDLEQLLQTPEGLHLEFKEAKNRFDFEELVRYCVALANEGGGKIVLGVTDRFPRRIVGTQAFENPERTVGGIIERLHLRVQAHELHPPQGRVLIFEVASRPRGVPVQYDGRYLMRGGESLLPMTSDQLTRIFAELEPDFSATLCTQATYESLAPEAITVFRKNWERRQPTIARLSDRQLLEDAELMIEGSLTYAALILMGTRKAIARHLDNAEVVFEYRSSRATGPAQERQEFRDGFLLWFDTLWERINARNDKQHYQTKLLMIPIPTFHEGSIREAILNAVSHRDYRDQ